MLREKAFKEPPRQNIKGYVGKWMCFICGRYPASVNIKKSHYNLNGSWNIANNNLQE